MDMLSFIENKTYFLGILYLILHMRLVYAFVGEIVNTTGMLMICLHFVAPMQWFMSSTQN